MTTLTKWAPFRELDLMERNMRRMFDVFGPVSTVPAADIYETKDEFVVELEVPGYEEKQLGIEVSDHSLVIKGERAEVKEQKDKTFHLHERLEKQFERRFVLPLDAKTDAVAAVFKQGVLEVRAPKAKELEPKKVAIRKA